MRYLFLLIFISNYCCSQELSIKGIINDNNGDVISFATIQLMYENKLVGYSTSNEEGFFEIEYLNQDFSKLTLKIAHIAYETKIINVENENIKITLNDKTNDLEEVVIQSKIGVAKIKGDTLSYNLKALTTGNEEKLADVLKKLPGIEINDDGKIMSQGKIIDNLMVNGKKMFGDNHKIATENINAEMLEGIDLLSNFENFAAIKEIEGSNKTALNINIKEEYLGKITGNIDLFGGIENRYQANSNLFKFNEKYNVSAIVNSNNTGYQPLSMKDYFSLNKSVRQEMRNNDVSTNSLTLNDIPKFLLSDNNVNSKSNDFIALDFAYHSSKNISINGFSIFSRLKTKEFSATDKRFFNNSTSTTISEFFSSKNELLFNQTKLNFDYKINKNNLINYTVLFDPTAVNTLNKFENDAGGSQNEIDEILDKINFKFGHQLSFISKIDKNKLLSFNFFQEFNKNRNNIDLNANYSLFNLGNNLSQGITEKNNDYGFYSKLTVKKNAHLYKLMVGYVFENSNFSSQNTIASNHINFGTNYFTTDASIQKNEGKFNYKAKTEFRNYYLNFNDETTRNNFLLPTFQVKYNLSQTHHLLANYSKVIEYYTSSNLNNDHYFDGFRNYYLNSSVHYSTPIEQEVYALNYFKFDLYNGIVIMLNSSYTAFGNRLSNNSTNAIDYIEIENINTHNQYAWNNILSYEHRITKIKNKFKISLNYIKSNFINQINSIENTQETELIGIKSSLISIFKNEFFNYEIGLNYNQQNNSLSLQKIENKVVQINPFISFNGKINSKISYFIDNSYEKFSAENETTNFYNLSFKLNYKNKKIRYWIEANNVLNVENAQIIKFISRNNYTSTEIVDRLAGYIGFGIGFNIK